MPTPPKRSKIFYDFLSGFATPSSRRESEGNDAESGRAGSSPSGNSVAGHTKNKSYDSVDRNDDDNDEECIVFRTSPDSSVANHSGSDGDNEKGDNDNDNNGKVSDSRDNSNSSSSNSDSSCDRIMRHVQTLDNFLSAYPLRCPNPKSSDDDKLQDTMRSAGNRSGFSSYDSSDSSSSSSGRIMDHLKKLEKRLDKIGNIDGMIDQSNGSSSTTSSSDGIRNQIQQLEEKLDATGASGQSRVSDSSSIDLIVNRIRSLEQKIDNGNKQNNNDTQLDASHNSHASHNSSSSSSSSNNDNNDDSDSSHSRSTSGSSASHSSSCDSNVVNISNQIRRLKKEVHIRKLEKELGIGDAHPSGAILVANLQKNEEARFRGPRTILFRKSKSTKSKSPPEKPEKLPPNQTKKCSSIKDDDDEKEKNTNFIPVHESDIQTANDDATKTENQTSPQNSKSLSIDENEKKNKNDSDDNDNDNNDEGIGVDIDGNCSRTVSVNHSDSDSSRAETAFVDASSSSDDNDSSSQYNCPAGHFDDTFRRNNTSKKQTTTDFDENAKTNYDHDLWLNRVRHLYASNTNTDGEIGELVSSSDSSSSSSSSSCSDDDDNGYQAENNSKREIRKHRVSFSSLVSALTSSSRSSRSCRSQADISYSSVSISGADDDDDDLRPSNQPPRNHARTGISSYIPSPGKSNAIEIPGRRKRRKREDRPSLTSTISQLSSRELTLEEGDDPESTNLAIKRYFKVWNIATLVATLFNVVNMKWKVIVERESWIMIFFACIFLLVQGILQWSVLEIPLMSFATLLVKPAPDRMADGKDLSVIINYNLLANDEDEIESTLQNAYEAYVGNLSPVVVAIMVSATGNPDLKAYELQFRDVCREKIKQIVLREGTEWANGYTLDDGRALRCFERYRNGITGEIDDYFIDTTLPALAQTYANNFMVIQRVTRSLRKCGQYQDLMLLSEGSNAAWTYTDNSLYSELARSYGEHVFYPSEDVDNTIGREFDYTLVLDGDTGVVKDSLSTLMDVAAANRERAVLQPSIKITARKDQSLFMHIDAMRQEINEPVSAALTTLLGRSGFFGKGLLQNKLYVEAMLGNENNPIEKVPIDVLSHDTFEAAALSPLYVNSVHLLEEPCGNYVTWDVRECRWNRGELVLSHYFFPETVGRFFTWLMHLCRDKPPPKLTLRTDTYFDEAGAYIAHSALRQMLLKPMLLLYIVGRGFVKAYLRNEWVVLASVMFAVIILPKFAIVRKNNLHKIVAETVCSVIQFTPEPIMGTYRTFKACKAHVTGQSGWVPQSKVEQDFAIRAPLVASFRYQWKVFTLTVAGFIPIIIFKPKDILLQLLFISTAILPVYTTLTALPYTALRYSTFMIICFIALVVIFAEVIIGWQTAGSLLDSGD